MADGHRSVQATGTAYTGVGKLKAVNASAAAAATVTVFDNTSATGTIVYEKELAAAETSYEELPDVELALGLHVVITGTAEVALHLS